jgi:hypothetical protein
MVLMNVPRLRKTASSLASLLRRDGEFVFSITHPCFWPAYWGYASEPWFAYAKTMAIKHPFRISLDARHAPPSTHIHRPLESYVHDLSRAGFVIQAIREPLPNSKAAREYPTAWETPRFLLARCRKR